MKKKLSLLFLFLFILLTSLPSFGQSKEYIFLNDFIKYVRNTTKVEDFDSYSFKTSFSLKPKYTEDTALLLYKINKVIDSTSLTVENINKIKAIDFSIQWDKKKVKAKKFFKEFDEIPKSSNGFRYVSFFTVSKPIFLGEYVLVIDHGGETCRYTSSSCLLFSWNQKNHSLTLIKDVFLWSTSPCFR